MLYAILAYHEEHIVTSWAPDEDAAVMAGLQVAHARLRAAGTLGPAARLGATKGAVTLRGLGDGLVIDGPFAETKEQLLGLYLYECPDRATAIAAARELHRANPTAVYEIRPVRLLLPGETLARSEAEV